MLPYRLKIMADSPLWTKKSMERRRSILYLNSYPYLRWLLSGLMKVSQGKIKCLKAQNVLYTLRYARGRRYSEKEEIVGKG